MTARRSDAAAGARRSLKGRTMRWMEGIGLALVVATAIRCSENPSTTSPRIQVQKRASLAIVPSFASLPSGLTIDLSRIRGLLVDAGGDTVVTESLFQGDSAVLQFTVHFSGNTGTFFVDLTAFDKFGQVAFHGTDTVTVTPGNNPPVIPPQMQYAGPDAGVKTIKIVPTPVVIDAGTLAQLGVQGFDASGQRVNSAIRATWLSRAPLVASVDPASGVVTAGASEGSTYVVATSITGAVDSVPVTVHAPVASLTVTPNPAQVVRNDSLQLTTVMQDAAGHPITGRKTTWLSNDPGKVTVSATGLLHGVALGSTTVSVFVEGKSVDVPVTVVSPVDHIEATPNPMSFTALGAQQTLAIKVVPRNNASLAGVATVVTVGDTNVIGIDGSNRVTARKNGSTSITIKADLSTLIVPVMVEQVAKTVTISPRSFNATAMGVQQQFTATIADSLLHPVAGAVPKWQTSSSAVVLVDNTGNATSQNNGSATVTASYGGLSDAANVTVNRLPARVSVTVPKTTIGVGELMTATASIVDANGYPMTSSIAWSSSNPAVLTVASTGVVTGLAAGIANVQAAAGGMSTGVTVTVANTSTMSLNLSTMEKLPNGTQRLYVLDALHNAGPYTWTVNGIANGNATFGTITVASGDTVLYTAPATMPSPATFNVCAARQAAPGQQGCVLTTIKPVPTSGGDVLVFNDLNVFDNNAASTPGNITMMKNLVNYTGAGSRVSQTGVWMYRGHGPRCSWECASLDGNWSTFVSTMASQGYTVTDVYDETNSALLSIPSDVKVIVLVLPTTSFSNAEINGLKQFSADGGRIVYVGEWDGYYGYGITVENNFFVSMGAVMRNTGGAVDCGYTLEPSSSIRPHEVTNGVTSITFACVSVVAPGPNDYVLVYATDGVTPLAAVAKVDLTPLPILAGRSPIDAPTLNRAPAAPQRTTDGRPINSWGIGPARVNPASQRIPRQ